MREEQAKFVVKNAWVFHHPELEQLREIVDASPLKLPLKIWECIADEEQGLSLGDIASRLRLNRNTVAIATRALEEAGLVTRFPHPENARQTKVICKDNAEHPGYYYKPKN